MSLLQLYVLRQIVPPFVLGLAFFPFICTIRLIFRLIDLVVYNGVSIAPALEMFGATMVGTAYLSIPMALLLGVLLGVGRLAADGEIDAMRALGLGVVRVTLPLMLIAAALTILLIEANRSFLPGMNLRATDAAMHLQYEMMTRPRAGQTRDIEGEFGRIGTLLYDWQEEPSKRMREVVLQMPTAPQISAQPSDAATPMLVVAQSGEIRPDPEVRQLTLGLASGSIHLIEDDPSIVARFARSEQTLPALFPRTISGKFKKSPQEMSRDELSDEIRTPSIGFVATRWVTVEQARRDSLTAKPGDRRFSIERWLRLCIPFACMTFTLLGVGLAFYLRPRSRFFGVMISLLVVFTYYGLVNCGIWLGRSGNRFAEPLIAGPNVLFAAIGMLLMRRK